MTVSVAQVGTLDLLTSPYTVKSFDLPDARLNAFGKSAQMAGMPAYESHYDDPPWEIVVIVSSPTRANVNALTNAFAAGALLTWGEGTGTATTTIRTVECADTRLASFGELVFSGTRTPAWETTASTFSGTITDGWGTFSLGTPGGELAAKMSLTMLCDSASTLLACGIRPNPGAGYDPIDDYGGALGTFDTNANLSGTAAALMTPATYDVGDNRGSHQVVARVKHTALAAASTKWQVGSTVGATTVWEPTVTSGVANNTETLALGSVTVPAAALPSSTVGSAFTLDETLSATGGAAADSPIYDAGDSYARAIAQTFTIAAARRLGTATVKVTNSSTAKDVLGKVIATSAGAPSPTVVYASQTVSAPNGTSELTFVFDVDLPAGTYALMFYTEALTSGAVTVQFWRNTDAASAAGVGYYRSSTAWTAGDGTDTTVDWVFSASIYELVTFSNATPLRATCSESSKTGAIDVLARIPADYGGFVVTGSFDAADGVTYDADLRDIFPADATGVIGTSLAATVTPLGTELAPVAGVPNTLVVACSAIDDVDVSGTITERRIHRG